MSKSLPNPFTTEQIVTGQQLIDRQKELAQVKQTLTTGGKLFLIAPRRYGKTSLLLTAMAQLREQQRKVIYVNLQGFSSLEAVIKQVLTQTANLNSNLKQATEKIRRVFRALNPQLSADPITGTLNVSLGLKNVEEKEQAPLLIEVLSRLEEIAQKSREHYGVIFDEFQEVLKLGGEAIENQLRAETQLHRRVGYIFSGSATSLLIDIVSNPKRPFYKLGLPLFLPVIPRPEFTAFIAAGFAEIKCQLDEAAYQTLFERANDVPHSVQMIAQQLWESARLNSWKKVAEAEIQQVVGDLLNNLEPIYAGIWTSLVHNQRKTLTVIARGRYTQLQSKSVLRELDLTAAHIHKALLSLEKFGVLRKEYRNTEVLYQFEDPMFRNWVLERTTI
jgi:hypothetical protein